MTKEDLKITGRSIEGDITSGRRHRTPQLGAQEFLAAIDKVLALPNVDSLRWRQYTPYFNDGEPCEFDVHEVGAKVVGGEEDGGDYSDGYFGSWELSYYKVAGTEELQAALKE